MFEFQGVCLREFPESLGVLGLQLSGFEHVSMLGVWLGPCGV